MQPIIPVVRTEPFDDPGWLFELKLDGFRGLADTVNGSMLLKNGNRMPNKLQDVTKQDIRGLLTSLPDKPGATKGFVHYSACILQLLCPGRLSSALANERPS